MPAIQPGNGSGADPAAMGQAAETLLRDGHPAEADRLLEEALARFPHDEALLRQSAWRAFSRRDVGQAVDLWERYRALHPEKVDSYVGGGVALRDAGRFDAADALYRAAMARFPRNATLMRDYAWVANNRPDVPAALDRWRDVTAMFPDDPAPLIQRGRLLRNAGRFEEAEECLAALLRRQPGSVDGLIERAWIAHGQRNWAEALRRWDAVASIAMGRPEGARGAAQCLLELGRPEDAKAVLDPAKRMFPDDLEMASLGGWIAHRLQDYPAADEIWRNVRARFPQSPNGFLGGAATYAASNRVAQAEELLLRAQDRFPDNVAMACEYARLAQQKDDKPALVARWQALMARMPNQPAVIAGLASALGGTGQDAEAARMLDTAVTRFPLDRSILMAAAKAATSVKDWEAAERLWRAFCAHFPQETAGWAGLADLQRERGALDQSLATVTTALARFRGDVELELQRAITLSRKRAWPQALSLWDTLKRRYPTHGGIQSGIVNALWQARQDQGVQQANPESGPPIVIPATLLVTPEENKAGLTELFGRFESIGDTCEFGIVQRRFGAEPLSLLRWASTPVDKLVTALDTDFAGVGEPEHTLVEDSHGEYTTRDKRYHMFSHTFSPVSSVPYERFFVQHCKRMQFLRRKLLDDLGTAAKILVYKSEHGITDTQVGALYRALHRFSPDNVLLCVRLADEQHAPGTLERMQPRLFIGYIDKFSTIDISVDLWLDLCRQTIGQLGA